MRVASAAFLVIGCGVAAADPAADLSSMVRRVAESAEQAASSGAGAPTSARAMATEDVRGSASMGRAVRSDRAPTEGKTGPGRASAGETVPSLTAPARATAGPDLSQERREAGRAAASDGAARSPASAAGPSATRNSEARPANATAQVSAGPVRSAALETAATPGTAGALRSDLRPSQDMQRARPVRALPGDIGRQSVQVPGNERDLRGRMSSARRAVSAEEIGAHKQRVAPKAGKPKG
jgi:hypothetical protein